MSDDGHKFTDAALLVIAIVFAILCLTGVIP